MWYLFFCVWLALLDIIDFVTSLLLSKHTMAEATHKRKHLIESLLTISKVESMIMVECMAAGS